MTMSKYCSIPKKWLPDSGKQPLDELYHHGIKGQKWGVRNGPPYPLDSSKSTGKRLKETSRRSISGNGIESDKAKKRYLKNSFKTYKYDKKDQELYREWLRNGHDPQPEDLDEEMIDLTMMDFEQNFKNKDYYDRIKKLDRSKMSEYDKVDPELWYLKQLEDQDRKSGVKNDYGNLAKTRTGDFLHDINYDGKSTDYDFWSDPKNTDNYVKFMNRIQHFSGDWYYSKPVSEGFKKISEEYEKLRERRDYLRYKKKSVIPYYNTKEYKKIEEDIKKCHNNLCGVVLEDLGYKDTPKNREMINSLIFWD